MVRIGTLTDETVDFLSRCIQAELNILISGGTGSGKTTLLNALSTAVPDDQRIVTIEDAAELKLNQRHVLRLESRPPNIEGQGSVPIRELVRNALRMRPDRIIVGEVRGAEALDMLQAMNTGHDGSLSTVHSNSTRDALARIETMVLMAGYDLPVKAIRQQVASALDLIVHLERLEDGSRRVMQITEVQRMESDVITLQDVFRFEIDKVVGRPPGRRRPAPDRPASLVRGASSRSTASTCRTRCSGWPARDTWRRRARSHGAPDEPPRRRLQPLPWRAPCWCRPGAHAQAGQLTLTPQQGTEFPDRTFVLTLPNGRPVDPATVSVTENGQPVDGVRIAPLQSLDQAGVVLVIDASDSMHGASIETAFAAARQFAAQRDPRQPLAVVVFNNRRDGAAAVHHQRRQDRPPRWQPPRSSHRARTSWTRPRRACR